MMRLMLGMTQCVLLAALSLTAVGIQAGLTEGISAYDKGHYANALQDLKPEAESGNTVAQYYMGLMFEEAKGLTADAVQARQWYERAARSGHAAAQFRLGRIHADGKGVVADGNKASHWYLQAAGQGNLDAQYSLGVMFKQGKGVPVDVVQAYLWFTRAAAQGLGNAAVQRDYLASRLTPEQKAEADVLLNEARASKESEQRKLEQERLRQAELAAQQKARAAAERKAQQEAARKKAEEAAAQAARDAAEKEAKQKAQQAAIEKAAQEKTRAEQAAKAAASAKQAQAVAQKAQAAKAANNLLEDMFREQFAADANEKAERLRKFNSSESITEAKLLSIVEFKATEDKEGITTVFVKYKMQKLLKGEGEPVTKVTSKWFRARRADEGYELFQD